MPCVSQALRNWTTSKSTRVTSSISNAITLALALISASKSGSASTRSLPMSLMLVPSLPLIDSIFSVTLDRRINERAREKLRWDGQRKSKARRVFGNYRIISKVQRTLCSGYWRDALEAGTSVCCSEMLSTIFRCVSSQLQRWAGTRSPACAIEGSQITSAMLLPADKASCARSGEGTVAEVKRTGNGSTA